MFPLFFLPSPPSVYSYLFVRQMLSLLLLEYHANSRACLDPGIPPLCFALLRSSDETLDAVRLLLRAKADLDQRVTDESRPEGEDWTVINFARENAVRPDVLKLLEEEHQRLAHAPSTPSSLSTLTGRQTVSRREVACTTTASRADMDREDSVATKESRKDQLRKSLVAELGLRLSPRKPAHRR